jgi:hypothetical protein
VSEEVAEMIDNVKVNNAIQQALSHYVTDMPTEDAVRCLAEKYAEELYPGSKVVGFESVGGDGYTVEVVLPENKVGINLTV